MEIFHERLKKVIEEAHISQRQIALRMGVKPQSVWEWVNVGYPSVSHLIQLCDMLNTTPNYLLGVVD